MTRAHKSWLIQRNKNTRRYEPPSLEPKLRHVIDSVSPDNDKYVEQFGLKINRFGNIAMSNVITVLEIPEENVNAMVFRMIDFGMSLDILRRA